MTKNIRQATTDTAMPNWDTITLKELVKQAEFLTRTDRKYMVPLEVGTQILEHLPEGTRVLCIDGKTQFAYSSTYFDTADDRSYLDAALKRRRRFKVRTRRYVDTGSAFLEIKTKSGRGNTVKERIPYDLTDTELTTQAQDFIEETLRMHDINSVPIQELTPTLECTYMRMTLLLPDGARATIDSDLTFTDLRSSQNTVSLSDRMIIETKTDGSQSVLDAALWAEHYRPTSVSKFATALAALRPQLPSNKWARTLNL